MKIDVREIPKPERHPKIHHQYGTIATGESIDVIAPHEPRPLRREFTQRYGEAFSWEVLETEAGRCRVRITKTDASNTDPDSRSNGDDSVTVTTELDVRDLPPAQRHEQIFESYADLARGEAFVLVNDHDPKPLYNQFQAEAGTEFHWEYEQKHPGEFRVLIGKSDGSDGSDPASGRTEAPF